MKELNGWVQFTDFDFATTHPWPVVGGRVVNAWTTALRGFALKDPALSSQPEIVELLRWSSKTKISCGPRLGAPTTSTLTKCMSQYMVGP